MNQGLSLLKMKMKMYLQGRNVLSTHGCCRSEVALERRPREVVTEQLREIDLNLNLSLNLRLNLETCQEATTIREDQKFGVQLKSSSFPFRRGAQWRNLHSLRVTQGDLVSGDSDLTGLYGVFQRGDSYGTF